MTDLVLSVPRADLAHRPCCVVDCSQRARWWVGPGNSNGLDDYTEVCADHVENVKGDYDVVCVLSD